MQRYRADTRLQTAGRRLPGPYAYPTTTSRARQLHQGLSSRARSTCSRCAVADLLHSLQILLATDNHIGYAETDPVRGRDSINTFREILQLAIANDVSEGLAESSEAFGSCSRSSASRASCS